MPESSLNDLKALEQLGSEAHARGESLLSNPYYRPDMLPYRTGEDVVDWGLKVVAWARGWRRARPGP